MYMSKSISKLAWSEFGAKNITLLDSKLFAADVERCHFGSGSRTFKFNNHAAFGLSVLLLGVCGDTRYDAYVGTVATAIVALCRT